MTQPGDLLLAAGLAVVGVAGTLGADHASAVDRPVDAAALALVVAAALAVALRRRWPVVTVAAATVLLAVYLLLGYPYGPVYFPYVVALYTVAAHRPLPVALPAALASLALQAAHLITRDSPIPGWLAAVPATAWVAVPVAVGVAVRLSREARRHAQAEAVRQRVYEERLRIAQEVHDVVGHGLAAIKMQAEVALHLAARKPEQAEQALAAISRASAQALEEVRATLAAVRHPDAGHPGAGRTPPPELGNLQDLRRRMTEAGMRVDLDTVGTPVRLPAAVELAGYRVVQESLTNALRHGARKVASVTLRYDADAVLIEVSNPAGPQPADRGGGLGIRGMAERVGALGGEFSAGPAGDGRFVVRARIPLPASTP